jgi:hypothetical protein
MTGPPTPPKPIDWEEAEEDRVAARVPRRR